MYCSKCGKFLPDGTKFCTACGAPVSQFSSGSGTGAGFETRSNYGYQQQDPYYGPAANVPAPDDAPSTGFAVLSFFFPLVGLILYLVWKDQYPQKAKSAGKGALIGVIVGFALVVLMVIFSTVFAFGILGQM